MDHPFEGFDLDRHRLSIAAKLPFDAFQLLANFTRQLAIASPALEQEGAEHPQEHHQSFNDEISKAPRWLRQFGLMQVEVESPGRLGAGQPGRGLDFCRFDEDCQRTPCIPVKLRSMRIPAAIAAKTNGFPESSYGACTVTLILSGGRQVRDVVLGGDWIVKVGGRAVSNPADLDFRVDDIVDAVPEGYVLWRVFAAVRARLAGGE